MKKVIYLLIVGLISVIGYGQCSTTSISSLIPNPSFENFSCCPSAHSQMTCANTWIQASQATSDYFNTCDYINTPSLSTPPSPIPHGNGYVGFFDGANPGGVYKEYIGACLSSPLLAGTSYTLQISLNATTADGSYYSGVSDLTREFVIYGTANCANLPFTGYTCPTAGWSTVHSQNVVLTYTSWTTATFTFTPSFNIYGLAFGGNCTDMSGGISAPSGGTNNYYYADNMILNTTTSFAPPSASAGPNSSITCTNTSVSLSGSVSGGTAPFSYSWNNGAGSSSSPTVSPSSFTTYVLTVTDANGCTDTDAVNVSINNSDPTANAGSNTTTNCSSPTATLNGSGGGSYSWSNGAGSSSSPTVNPSSTTTYILTVTGSNGCTDTDAVTVTVDESGPSANAGSNMTTTCNSSTATLSGSGTGSLSWSHGLGSSSNPVVNPSSTTSYTLTVTASNGCTDTDIVTVTVDETAPTASAGSNITLDCATTSDSFAASGGGTYSWISPNGTSSSAGFSVTDTDTPGSYTVTVTAANGCTDTDVATLSIDQTDPVANAGIDQTSSCALPAVTLDGSSSSGFGISYSWSGPNVTAGGTTSMATANVAGTYTLVVTGSNSCTHSDQVDVLPDLNVPVANAGADQVLDCNNPSVTLDGSSSDTGATITYVWTTAGGNITGGTNTNSATADLDGTYTITVSNSANGCSATDAAIVTQDTVTPVTSVTNTNYVIDCNNPTATFDASGTSGIGNTFNWTTVDGNIVSGGTTSAPTVDLDGIYSLSVTSANGCDNLNVTNVTVTIDTLSPAILVNIADTLTCNILQVTLDASGSQSGVTYNWSTLDGFISAGSTTATPTVDSSGSYILTITSPNGCTSSVSSIVVDSEVPEAHIVTNTTEGEVDLTVAFSDTSSGVELTHHWDFGTGNMDYDTITPTQFTYSNVQEYEVVLTVVDQYGCIAIDTVTINALELSDVEIPNIFTPNGDGVNDSFQIIGGGVKNMKGSIMNRWGQLIYEWDSPYGGWDGYTTAGVEASPGTYFYFINVDFNDGHSETLTGSCMLKR